MGIRLECCTQFFYSATLRKLPSSAKIFCICLVLVSFLFFVLFLTQLIFALYSLPLICSVRLRKDTSLYKVLLMLPELSLKDTRVGSLQWRKVTTRLILADLI